MWHISNTICYDTHQLSKCALLNRRSASAVKGLLSIYLPSLSGGGAERAMLTLANAFVARGLPVDLVLAKAEGPYL